MELYKDILVRLLEKHTVKVEFSMSEQEITKAIKDLCYSALRDISHILKDDSLSDKDCFLKIEEIICQLEKHGIDFGTRHDFG